MTSQATRRIPNDFDVSLCRILLRTAASLGIPVLGSSWLTTGAGTDPAPNPGSPHLACADKLCDATGMHFNFNPT